MRRRVDSKAIQSGIQRERRPRQSADLDEAVYDRLADGSERQFAVNGMDEVVRGLHPARLAADLAPLLLVERWFVGLAHIQP